MERRMGGWIERRIFRGAWKGIKGTCHQVAGYFTKPAVLMAVAAVLFFSGGPIPVSYGAE